MRFEAFTVPYRDQGHTVDGTAGACRFGITRLGRVPGGRIYWSGETNGVSMITEKGPLTMREQEQLAAYRAHTAEVNLREFEANIRGLIASMSITPRPPVAQRARRAHRRPVKA